MTDKQFIKSAIFSDNKIWNKKINYICKPNKLFRMISRRNIRVKVMQALYSAETDNSDFTTQKLLRMVEWQAMLKWSHNSTLSHTLLHFSYTVCTRNPCSGAYNQVVFYTENSKSHFRGHSCSARDSLDPMFMEFSAQ